MSFDWKRVSKGGFPGREKKGLNPGRALVYELFQEPPLAGTNAYEDCTVDVDTFHWRKPDDGAKLFFDDAVAVQLPHLTRFRVSVKLTLQSDIEITQIYIMSRQVDPSLSFPK